MCFFPPSLALFSSHKLIFGGFNELFFLITLLNKQLFPELGWDVATGTQMPGASAGVLEASAWPLSAAPEGLWSPAVDLLSCVTVPSCREIPRIHQGLYQCHSMSMVRQLSSAWKGKELLENF